MPIEYQDWISRQDLRNNPDKFYIFGDNVERRGFGGQAKEMRGEPNAIGVPTKWQPNNEPNSFFNDIEFHQNIRNINRVFEDQIFIYLENDFTVIFPKDGIGSGLSDLPNKAPKTLKYLKMLEQFCVENFTK